MRALVLHTSANEATLLLALVTPFCLFPRPRPWLQAGEFSRLHMTHLIVIYSVNQLVQLKQAV